MNLHICPFTENTWHNESIKCEVCRTDFKYLLKEQWEEANLYNSIPILLYLTSLLIYIVIIFRILYNEGEICQLLSYKLKPDISLDHNSGDKKSLS